MFFSHRSRFWDVGLRREKGKSNIKYINYTFIGTITYNYITLSIVVYVIRFSVYIFQ